jgi:hypothetical protein
VIKKLVNEEALAYGGLLCHKETNRPTNYKTRCCLSHAQFLVAGLSLVGSIYLFNIYRLKAPLCTFSINIPLKCLEILSTFYI